MLPMSQATDFVKAVDGRIKRLDTLKQEGAEEGSSNWRFPDGSQVTVQWVAGLNGPGTYHIEEVDS